MDPLVQNLKFFKFKILKKTTEKTQNTSKEYEINNREVLKILHLISFEEKLQNNSLTRSSLNLLSLLNLNINTCTNKLVQYNPIFKNTYNHTVSINILYNIFKTQKV